MKTFVAIIFLILWVDDINTSCLDYNYNEEYCLLNSRCGTCVFCYHLDITHKPVFDKKICVNKELIESNHCNYVLENNTIINICCAKIVHSKNKCDHISERENKLVVLVALGSMLILLIFGCIYDNYYELTCQSKNNNDEIV